MGGGEVCVVVCRLEVSVVRLWVECRVCRLEVRCVCA